MRRLLGIALLSLAATSQADKVYLLENAPSGCQARDTVAIESGGKLQGLLFSDAWIENNAKKKLFKAIRKADGNRAVLKDRRVFLMDNHHRGVQRIALEAWTWRCEEPVNSGKS
jgi:hypothetical protein